MQLLCPTMCCLKVVQGKKFVVPCCIMRMFTRSCGFQPAFGTHPV